MIMSTTDPTESPLFKQHRSNGATAPTGSRRTSAAHNLAGRVDRPRTTAPGIHVVPAASLRDAAAVIDLPASAALLGWAARPTVPSADAETIDWTQVAVLRSQASTRLTEMLGEDRGQIDVEQERELGRTIIDDLLQSTIEDAKDTGSRVWSRLEQAHIAKAVYDALFGLGRWQPLVDDDTIENIIVASGYDNVWVERTDGSLTRVEPVADSDSELLDFLAFVASRSEANARPFSPATPSLHMRLDGGERLAAAAWVTARPSVVIRRHRLRRVNLDDLVGRHLMSPTAASFLAAAIRAKKSIVVAGQQGAGKTTLVRALCAEIPPWEAIGTFETELELFLHQLRDLHPIVHAWEARPGSGEYGPDGREAGAFTLLQALYDSFRFNLTRQIVGEVRGSEVWAMIKAMESGAGSISTTHAANGAAALRKLVTCAMEAGAHVTKELATTKLAETIDIIVQLNLETKQVAPNEWRRRRWISEIIHVAPGEEHTGYAMTHVFRSAAGQALAVPGTLPDELRVLEEHGFDLTSYLEESE